LPAERKPAVDAPPYTHPTSVVGPEAQIGPGTRIWHFCHVMDGARIGAGCSFGQNCFVAAGVVVGDRVKVQNNVSLYDGVVIGDEVFIGPSVVFTNVTRPRAAISRRDRYERTRVERGATIGANATILPGVVLGEYCFVAAGAVVRRDVEAHALVAGVPARRVGWVSRHGERLDFDAGGSARCPATGEQYEKTLRGARLLRDDGREPKP
jgi:UDP-2-acetamido-3-amino-2,3-dideoxy-glucuronate N-acetyltransferase